MRNIPAELVNGFGVELLAVPLDPVVPPDPVVPLVPDGVLFTNAPILL